MSLRNSLQKLKEVIHAAKPPTSFPPTPWDQNCCVHFTGIGTTDPKVYLICSGRVVRELQLNEVPRNAISCENMPEMLA